MAWFLPRVLANLSPKCEMPMKTLLSSLFAVFLWSANALAAPITWNESGPVTPIPGWNYFNAYNFDGAQMLFAPIIATHLEDVLGAGLYHSHGSSQSRWFRLHVLVEGNWQEAWVDTIPAFDGADRQIGDIAGPGNERWWSGSIVHGIRLIAEPVDLAFHLSDFNPPTFIFAGDEQSVPAPAGLALLSAGLLALGIVRRRRQKQA
jgi:hypothetical protein